MTPRSYSVDALVSGVADQAAATVKDGGQACFVEAVLVMPASGKGFALGVYAPVCVANDLDVDA